MQHPPAPRRHRAWLPAIAVAALAIVAFPLVGASPAGAATADLVTTDGVGIRVDETAILGPALEAIEDEMQVVADDLIQTGAEENSVMDNPDWVWTDNNLELDFDFVNAGTAGYPQGGLKVHADIQDVEMQFYRYGEWWQPECLIIVEPDDATIDASAYIDTSKLPGAPLTVNPIQAYWDEEPNVRIADGYSSWCNGYLIDEWWEGLWGGGTDIAAGIEAELDGQAQGLIDDLWAEHVMPVIDSLEAFGITFGQIRTDDHGLIVTANVDATNGVRIPGVDFDFPVADTPDSGVTSDVNTLLAQRGEIIASIHPNVVAQYLNAIDQTVSGQYGGGNIDGPQIEALLLDPADRALYADNGWFLDLNASRPPAVTPTGVGGAPQVGLAQMQLVISHSSNPFEPVATFEGTMEEIALVTEVRSGSDLWGPAFDASAATLPSLTRTQANADASAVSPQTGTQMAPIARISMDRFSDNVFVPSLSLAPISVGGLSLDLCTTCGRYSGDQRYTETFEVGVAP